MRQRAHARRPLTPRWRSALAAAGAAAAGMTAAAPTAARAQGFGLNEIGSCALARGFAVTSTPCGDASSLYWNPGAVSNLPMGVSVYLGATAIAVKGRFTADNSGRAYNSNVPTAVPPFAGLAVRTVPRLMLGIATYVPYGLTSQWNNDFPGKFSAQKAALQDFYIQPTAAYELVPGRLSVGAGAILAYSQLELRQSLDFAQGLVPGQGVSVPNGTTFAALGIQPGTEFATAKASANAVGGGWTVGLHAKPFPSISIGARYLSKVRFDYRGGTANFYTSPSADSVVFQAGNPLGVPAGTSLQQVVAPQFVPSSFVGAGGSLVAGQTVSTHITNPAQYQVGVGYTGVANTSISFDYANIQWSSFQTLPITFTRPDGTVNATLSRTQIEQYKNSSSYRAGLEHGFANGKGVVGRLGFAYSEAAAPAQTVTPLLPDMNRYNFGGGLGIPLAPRRFAVFGEGNYMLDVSYLRVETEGRRGRTVDLPNGVTSNGFYNLGANVFSASVRATF